jgi:hypothetical protein
MMSSPATIMVQLKIAADGWRMRLAAPETPSSAPLA